MNQSRSCHVEVFKKQSSPDELANVHSAVLDVRGMGCPRCAQRVQNSLLKVRGIVNADVDHQSGIALVRFNPTMLSPDEMLQAVEAAGGDGKHEYAGRLVALPNARSG
jgi:copper chaperone CopZ